MIDRNLIADFLREIGYLKLAKAVKKESCKKTLDGYAKVAEIKAYKLQQVLNEIYGGSNGRV